MSAASTGTPAGRPSRTETRDCPCDSPAVVKRNGLRRSSLDVRCRQVDDDKSALRERKELKDNARVVSWHGPASADRTVDRILQLERTAVDEVRDIDDLYGPGRRGDECGAFHRICRVA